MRPIHPQMRSIPAPILRALLLAVALLAVLAPASAQAATLGCSDDSAGTTDLSSWIPEMLAATNAHRASIGVPALQLDPTLTSAAAWKSRDMARRSYFTHDDPAGPGGEPARTPWERLTACGFGSSGSRAENIAAGQQSGEAFMTAWLNSAGHRANIENASYRYVGFGVASSTNSTYGTYATQMFSSVPGPVAATPTPTTTDPTAPTTSTGEDRAPQAGGTDASTTVTGSGAVTRSRCRSRLAVAGWCYALTVRGRLISATPSATAGRSVTIVRRTAAGGTAAVGTATTRADGSFVVRRALRPTARGTRTWLARNATSLQAVAAATATAPASRTASLFARVRL